MAIPYETAHREVSTHRSPEEARGDDAQESVDAESAQYPALTPEQESRFGLLPEKSRSWYTRLRERLSSKTATERVEAAKTYYTEQREAIGDVEKRIAEDAAEIKKLEDQLTRGAMEQVETEEAPNILRQLLDDPTLDALGRKKLDSALDAAQKRGDAELTRIEQQTQDARARIAALEQQSKKFRATQKDFEHARDRAREQLDEAVTRAINETHKGARQLESDIAETDKTEGELKATAQKLDGAVESLSAKFVSVQGTIVMETMTGVLKDAKKQAEDQKRALQEVRKTRAEHEKKIEGMTRKSMQLVAALSQGKIGQLMEDSDHAWIRPMLSAQQVSQLPTEMQSKILADETCKKELIPRLDKAKLLDPLIEAGIVSSREDLITQGLLVKPEPPKATSQKEPETEKKKAGGDGGAEQVQASASKEAEVKEPNLESGAWWEQKLGGAYANKNIAFRTFEGDALSVMPPAELAGYTMTTGDVADLAHDRLRGILEDRLEENQKLEPLKQQGLWVAIKGLLVDLLDLSPEQKRTLNKQVHAKPKGRRVFRNAVEDWNTQFPDLSIDEAGVHPRLATRDLSPMGVQYEILAKLKEQGKINYSADPKVQAAVDTFFKKPKKVKTKKTVLSAEQSADQTSSAAGGS